MQVVLVQYEQVLLSVVLPFSLADKRKSVKTGWPDAHDALYKEIVKDGSVPEVRSRNLTHRKCDFCETSALCQSH